MPLRTAAKLCPHAIFVNGHPERYRECSEKVYGVLTSFSPLVEMASIDEAYLDMTGTARLHGPPLGAAHALHQKIKSDTQLNCSIGIGVSRLIFYVTKIKNDAVAFGNRPVVQRFFAHDRKKLIRARACLCDTRGKIGRGDAGYAR